MTSRDELNGQRLATSPARLLKRLLSVAAIAAGSLLAATPAGVEAANAKHCPNLSRSVVGIVVTGLSCRSADAVIRARLSGERKLDGFSCLAASGSKDIVSCRRGRLRLLYSVVAPSSVPAQDPSPTMSPGLAPSPTVGPTPSATPTPQPTTPRDTIAITTATVGPSGLLVIASATADDAHDGLLVWATAGSCATDVPTAEGPSGFGGPGGLIASEVGRGASGAFETPIASYDVEQTGPYTTTVTITKAAIAPDEFSTVCALLYDPVGEPAYASQPFIPRDYVFLTAQAPIT